MEKAPYQVAQNNQPVQLQPLELFCHETNAFSNKKSGEKPQQAVFAYTAGCKGFPEKPSPLLELFYARLALSRMQYAQQNEMSPYIPKMTHTCLRHC